VRWQLGEDLASGPVRDMMHPERFDDPDRMTSASYKGTSRDNGGVHSNSGVNNKGGGPDGRRRRLQRPEHHR